MTKLIINLTYLKWCPSFINIATVSGFEKFFKHKFCVSTLCFSVLSNNYPGCSFKIKNLPVIIQRSEIIEPPQTPKAPLLPFLVFIRAMKGNS